MVPCAHASVLPSSTGFSVENHISNAKPEEDSLIMGGGELSHLIMTMFSRIVSKMKHKIGKLRSC